MIGNRKRCKCVYCTYCVVLNDVENTSRSPLASLCGEPPIMNSDRYVRNGSRRLSAKRYSNLKQYFFTQFSNQYLTACRFQRKYVLEVYKQIQIDQYSANETKTNQNFICKIVFFLFVFFHGEMRGYSSFALTIKTGTYFILNFLFFSLLFCVDIFNRFTWISNAYFPLKKIFYLIPACTRRPLHNSQFVIRCTGSSQCLLCLPKLYNFDDSTVWTKTTVMFFELLLCVNH